MGFIDDLSNTPYVHKEPSDKEIIENLEFCGNYEALGRITELKRENASLKGQLTKLKKKILNINNLKEG